jgi:hypothetical protein
MFLLPDGRPLAPDVAFNIGDTYFPAKWLRLSSPDERAAVGITEVPDPPSYDQRFYWGYTASGTLIPKDHGVLVSGWSDQTNQTAYTLLAPTDWQIIRQSDDGTPAEPLIVTWRQNIRQSAAEKVTTIKSTTTTDELAAYVTGPDYPVWPPVQPEPSGIPSGTVSSDTLSFSYNSTSVGISSF